MVKLLLGDERTNPDASAHDGDLALDVAVNQKASLEVVEYLAKNTSQFSQEQYASRLLYEAARNASVDVVKFLISASPADIQGKKQWAPCSPVFIAMARNEDDVIEVLLEACNDVNDLYDEKYLNKTIVFAIEANCSLDIIRILIKKGAFLNLDVTALMYAISNERIDVALELLKHGVDVNKEYNGSTALTSAILIRHRDLTREILSVVSFEVLESLCEKPGFNGVICCAISQLDTCILSMLLDCNFSEPILEAPVKIRFRLSRLILFYEYIGPLAFLLKEKLDTYKDESISVVQLLLSKGISVEPRKPSYMPPLVGALLSKSSNGDSPPTTLLSALKILLDSGVNVDHMTSVLPDALLTAIYQENLEAFLMLLPYSQYSPCDIVRVGIEHNMDFLCTYILETLMNVDYYLEIRSLFRNNVGCKERCEELFSRFSFKVVPLTVIARRKVRQCLQKCSTSGRFLSVVNELAIPETLKFYLRFC